MRRSDTFVGRARELAELRGALADAENGRGRLLLISGEPGIGKTRLANEVSEFARDRGVRTVWGRCWEGDGSPAYWPWIQVIRSLIASLDASDRGSILESESAAPMVETVARIVPELYAAAPRATRPPQAGADPAQTQFRLFDSVAGLLKEIARHGPIAILLDDLHNADNASLTMLRFVARESTGAGVLIIGTYRDREVQRSPVLSQLIGDLGREARALPLAGLSPAEVAQFFNAVVGRPPDAAMTEKLHEATAGNPLFVDGIVRGLVAQPGQDRESASQPTFNIPHSVREAIARRLAKLSEQTRALLQVAAAIGNDFDAALCARAMGLKREQINSRLDEATRDGIVITLGQGRYRFAHALIRASIYEDLDTNARLRLHRAIADAMEELYADNPAAHLDELAHHFREAGLDEKAIDYSYRAGHSAFAVFAYAGAAAHWRVALTLTEGQRNLRRADILYWLGRSEGFFLDPPRGLKHLEDSLSLYEELDDPAWTATLNTTLGLVLVFLSDFAPDMNIARSLDYLRKGQAWEGPWFDETLPGWMHRGMSIALFQQARIEEALRSAQHAYQLWREASHPQWLDAGAWLAQLLTLQGRHREAAAIREEVTVALRAVRDPVIFHTVTWSIGWVNMVMLNPVEARRCFTMITEHEGLSAHQRAGGFEFLVQTEAIAGNLARAKEIAATYRTNPSFRASISRLEGDFEGAAELERTMVEWGRRTGHIWDVVAALPAVAVSVNLAGDSKQAMEILEEEISLYEPSNYWLETGVRPLAVALELELGRPDKAEAHLQVCREILAKGENWSGRAGLTYLAEGRLAAAVGRPFAEHFEKAIDTFKRYSVPFDEANALVSWGSALLGTENRAEADEKFDAAREIYRRCGAGQRWIERLEAARNKPSPPSTVKPDSSSTFRGEGDFWTIAHNGKTVRLRDIKGLGYLAHLLARPGERIHAIELIAAVEGSAASVNSTVAMRQGLSVERDLGDAGEVLDAQAREEYRHRKAELRVELDAAERDNDPGRAEAARHELDLITDELSAAVGKGGRVRKSYAHSERARSLVTKHIRNAIDLIRSHNGNLADHLDRSIQTGAHCGYLPDATEKISWQL